MYFDHRDVAANTGAWFKSINKRSMTITIEIAGDDEILEDFKQDLSEEAFKLIDKDGCVTLPMKYEVCPTCNGKGRHVNPSIDAHGITAEEWDRDWDYEDREMYLNGSYDVTCYECNGTNVVPEINKERLSPATREIVDLVERQRAEEASYVRMCMMERAMGA